MVDYQSKVREKLQLKIFSQIGKTVTFKKKSSPIYNTRGDLEGYTETNTEITIVPYNIIDKNRSYQEFGELLEGEFDAAVPYSENISEGDLIEMEGEDWKIQRIDKNYLPGNVVTIIRLTRA